MGSSMTRFSGAFPVVSVRSLKSLQFMSYYYVVLGSSAS
jgi:hypothetical protein